MRDLTNREKGLLGLAMLLTVVSAAWMLIVMPMMTARAASLTEIRKADAIADLLVTTVGEQTRPVARQPLQTIITQRAKAADLTIRRLDPSENAMSVTLDDAPYSAVIGWMAALTAQEGLRIASVEIGRRTTPGIVATQITVETDR